jgi:hypothetical protein
MTKFTPEQQKVLEKKIRFMDGDRFDIIGNLYGSVGGDVCGDVWGSIWGGVDGSVGCSVQKNIGYGWVRKEPNNNPEIPDGSKGRAYGKDD